MHRLRIESGRKWVSVSREIRNMWLRTGWELKVVVNRSASVEKVRICDYAPTESWKWSWMGQRRSRHSEYVITQKLRVESGHKWLSVGRECWNMWLRTNWELKVAVNGVASVENFGILWLRTNWELKVVIYGSASVEKFGICDYAPSESWKWS